jgi:hypothetical protein
MHLTLVGGFSTVGCYLYHMQVVVFAWELDGTLMIS